MNTNLLVNNNNKSLVLKWHKQSFASITWIFPKKKRINSKTPVVVCYHKLFLLPSLISSLVCSIDERNLILSPIFRNTNLIGNNKSKIIAFVVCRNHCLYQNIGSCHWINLLATSLNRFFQKPEKITGTAVNAPNVFIKQNLVSKR